MNSQLKTMLNPKLYNAFLEIAKTDIVLESVTKKTDKVETFVNALLAAVICISDREFAFQELVKQILESNPQIKDILLLKKEALKSNHDTSLLPPKENS